MIRAKEWAYMAACIVWFAVVSFPAWVIWIIALGSVRLDIRIDNMNHIMDVPGWTRSELTYYVPAWRPF